MLFNSYIFIFFLVGTIMATLVAGRFYGSRGEIGVLTAASLLFYAYSGWGFTVILMVSLVINYGTGEVLKVGKDSCRKYILTIGIGFSLGMLIWFKYVNFLIEQAEYIFKIDVDPLRIALPVGISFYTFQQIAYLVDIYRCKPVSHGFIRYVLFVSFFPQLIAGPIVHHSEMMPQFSSRIRMDWAEVGAGITIFAIGLTKKVYFADALGDYVRVVFRDAAALHPDFRISWIAALCFTLQIYFDFSGYSDMAIGLGRIFGIRLPFNFASPYKATSIIDFWRRWHITLSRFLRDYLYISLGGNRGGPVRRNVNVSRRC